MSNMEKEKCPKCGSPDVSCSNVEGFECLVCGCWFDLDVDGEIVFMFDSAPDNEC